ncbi:MAG: hypothetical protein JXQ27_06820 [Acidobacteria bacterium]|nr:hypothetical protein [Acidobacteriota bacterium]
MRYSVWPVLVILVIFIAPSAAQSRRPMAKTDPNLTELKKESEIFENIVNTALRQAVPHPMFIAGKARGSYLEGYGITFTMTINLNRKLILFPKKKDENPPRSEEEEIHTFLARIRHKLTTVLEMYGDTLKQLTGDAHISLVVHVLSRSVLTNENFTRIMVLTTTKDTIAEHRRKVNTKEFYSKVHYVEY